MKYVSFFLAALQLVLFLGFIYIFWIYASRAKDVMSREMLNINEHKLFIHGLFDAFILVVSVFLIARKRYVASFILSLCFIIIYTSKLVFFSHA